MQGVSRLIAAGLAISDLPYSPALAPSPLPTSRTRRPRPASIALPLRPTHSTTQSNSSSASTFTSTTKSTRFSQSSASSFGEDVIPSINASPGHAASGKETEADLSSSSDDNVLMVQDTGATPTMSPNPAFVQRQRRREERELKRASLGLQQSTSTTSVRPCVTAEGPQGDGGMTVRRRSRESQNYGYSPFFDDASRTALSHTLGDLSHSPVSTSPLEEKDSKAKRASVMMNAAGFPLGSLALTAGSAVVAAGAQPVSSWVGNVGRKWEELQKGNST